MALSENIRLAREAKSMSQKELAQLVGISQPAIAQYEIALKVPTVIVAVKLARVLNTTCEELVNGTPEEPQDKPA